MRRLRGRRTGGAALQGCLETVGRPAGLRYRNPCSILLGFALFTALATARPAAAQQRPLVTEDPEPIGAGRVLFEGGLDLAHDYQNPVSGLKGNLFTLPTIGISVGLSSIAEFQIDGGIYNHLSINARNPNAPRASLPS